MDVIYRKIELSERELSIFLALDEYKNREIDRRIILNKTNVRIPYLSKVIYKFVRLGLFDINIKYMRVGYRKIVYLVILPKYTAYKIVNEGNKKILWVKIAKK